MKTSRNQYGSGMFFFVKALFFPGIKPLGTHFAIIAHSFIIFEFDELTIWKYNESKGANMIHVMVS